MPTAPLQSGPQRDTVALLTRLSGHAPIVTPISAVFVGVDTVWKLRRAVHLPFIDFTSLPARAHAAQREFKLNSAWAPHLYRDVVAVTLGPGGPELGGRGEVIDYVVRMARVPEGDFLLARAASTGLDGPMLDQLGDMVAEMHAGLAPLPDADPLALERIMDGNRATALVAGLPPERIAAWHHAVQAELVSQRDWFAERIAQGFVRRCHGDLHLGNLCIFEGRLTAFDAIEFDEDMATTDLGYDLAFLLMDLDLRVGRAAANRVLNRYLARRPDVAMLRAMPVFLSQRALVRAHVAANSGRDWQPFLDYAEAVMRPAPPVALGIGGLPGTGKSTLARALAPEIGPAPGAVVLRSDEIRKRLCGVAPEQRLPESAYAPDVSRRVMQTMFAAMAEVIAARHAVIADQTFLDPESRLAAKAAAGDAPFIGVWLTAPLPVLEARIRARHGDASDATPEILHKLAALDQGAGDWVEIDSTAPDSRNQIASHIRNASISC